MKSFSEFLLLSEAYNPKKTVVAYKLFRVNEKTPGKLFPLYVSQNSAVPMGSWVEAKSGDRSSTGKVKSKLGPLAYRPGWHSGDVPVATHIGVKPVGGKPKFRAPNQVWAKVLVPNDHDWQTVANSRATISKKGKPVARTAHITDQIPLNGHYRYKTNSNMTGNWIISGQMKVVKILTDNEVIRINSGGVRDLPREEPIDLKKFGF